MPTAPLESSQDLPPSLAAICRALEARRDLTAIEAKAIVNEAGVTPDDLQPWVRLDHPETDSYGRALVHDGGFYEIMVMSWRPGDYSAIHDHGHTQWGAVQVLGPADHAVFAVDAESLTNISRNRLTPGRILAVDHNLVHQMGNPTEEPFLSLHVYGSADRTSSVTADARVFDLSRAEIQYTDGGVFYALPDEAITSRRPCPDPGFYAWLFDTVQRLIRERKATIDYSETLTLLTDRNRWSVLREELGGRIDEQGHITDSRYWGLLYEALRQAATLQDSLIDQFEGDDSEHDLWRTYARLYDHVIGTTNSYIPRYLGRVFDQFGIDPTAISFLDIGCGTGWLEQELIRRFHLRRESMLGVDPSQAMLDVASERCPAALAALPEVAIDAGPFDLVFCNSYQYMRHEDLERAIDRVFDLTAPGGLCVSEFITQDHIRWYPNVVFSEGDMVVSLRNPTLHERGGFTYQDSEIFNISRLGKLRITCEGVHRRFLISPLRVHDLIANRFGGEILMYDAVTFEPLSPLNETCPSARFVICARRGS